VTSQVDPTVIPDDRKVRKADLREQLEIIAQELTELEDAVSIPRQSAFNFEDDPQAIPPPASLTGLDGSGILVTATGSSIARTLAARFAQVYDVQDYPIPFNGVTDSTAALQSLINAVPNGSIINFSNPNAIYVLTSTLTMTDKRNVWLVSGLDPRNFGQTPSFLWNGGNHGVMVDMVRCQNCHIEGFTWNTTGGVTVDTVFNIDGYAPGNISTQNVIRYNAINLSNQTNSATKAIAISATAVNNCENIDIWDNLIVLSPSLRPLTAGIGIWVSTSSNAKHHRVYRNAITQGTIGIQVNNGSVDIQHLGGGYNATDIEILGASEPIYIRQIDTEGSGVSVHFIPSNQCLTLDDCRFANGDQTNAGGFIKVTGLVTIRNCSFEARPPVGGTLIEFNGTGALGLTIHDCIFQANTTYAESGLQAYVAFLDANSTIGALFAWNLQKIVGMPSRYAMEFAGTLDPVTNDPTGHYFGTSVRFRPRTYNQIMLGGAIPTAGAFACFSDATVNTHGAVISSGGGTNTVLGFFDGSFWTVCGRPALQVPRTVTSATYTVVASDDVLIFNHAGTVTVTFPAANANPGRKIRLKTITANTVVSVATDVVALDGTGPAFAILAATAGKWCDLEANGTNWEIMASN